VLNTSKGLNNSIKQNLQNVNISFQSYGFKKLETYKDQLFRKLFLGGNLGVGVDLGFTYNFSNQFQVTASIQDLGLIFDRKNVENVSLKGSFSTKGVFLNSGNQTGINYFNKIIKDFQASVVVNTNSRSYLFYREPKFNGSVGYKFGLPRYKACIIKNKNQEFLNQIGMQIFFKQRLNQPQFSSSFFYYRKIANFLKAKIAYTINSFSPKNIGLGISSKIQHVNIFIGIDNLLGTSNILYSNNEYIQFGVSLIY